MTLIKLGSFEIDIEASLHPHHSDRDLLLQLLGRQKHQERLLKEIMITQESLNATATRLETNMKAIIALLPANAVPSTPDTDVSAFQARIDAASASMETAITPPPPAPPTP